MKYQYYTQEFSQDIPRLSPSEVIGLKIVKDLKDFIKPYKKSTKQIILDLFFQPFHGLMGMITGALLVAPFILLSFFTAPFQKQGFTADLYKFSTTLIKNVVPTLFYGAFLIALWPFQVLLAPLRGIITWFKEAPKIEDSKGLQFLATRYNQIIPDTDLAKQSQALIAGVLLKKFTKALMNGQKTQIIENSAKTQEFYLKLDALNIPRLPTGQPVLSATPLPMTKFVLITYPCPENVTPAYFDKLYNILRDQRASLLIQDPTDKSIRLYNHNLFNILNPNKERDLPILKNRDFANLTFPENDRTCILLPHDQFTNEMACEMASITNSKFTSLTMITPKLDEKWVRENANKDFSGVMTFFQNTFSERKTEIAVKKSTMSRGFSG
jgi:hypothetical protein